MYYFSSKTVEQYRFRLEIPIHDETTIYNDFWSFIEDKNYTMSYKMIMILSMIKILDNHGECSLEKLKEEYVSFYKDRLEHKLPVDKKNCPYDQSGYLDDDHKMKTSILANPFEKFERKRFMYHCKDLNRISFSHNLWTQLVSNMRIADLKSRMYNDLLEYYSELGGIPEKWKEYWGVT